MKSVSLFISDSQFHFQRKILASRQAQSCHFALWLMFVQSCGQDIAVARKYWQTWERVTAAFHRFGLCEVCVTVDNVLKDASEHFRLGSEARPHYFLRLQNLPGRPSASAWIADATSLRVRARVFSRDILFRARDTRLLRPFSPINRISVNVTDVLRSYEPQ